MTKTIGDELERPLDWHNRQAICIDVAFRFVVSLLQGMLTAQASGTRREWDRLRWPKQEKG